MSRATRYAPQAPGLAPGEERHLDEVDQAGNKFVTRAVRHLLAVTVGTPIYGGPCDCLYASAPCNATIQAAEDGAPIAGIPLVAGRNNLAAVLVTAVSGGASLVAGWLRCPPGPPPPPPTGPSITSLSVSTGTTLGGTEITIEGVDLAGATAVTLDGIAATVVSSTSTSIVCTSGYQAAGPGTGDVVATVTAGSATLAGGWSYTFAPTDVSDTVLWLRADLGVTLNGSNVSAWADQSGKGNDFTQAGTLYQPPHNTSVAAFGGQATIGGGGDGSLVGPSTTALLAGATAAEMFAVLLCDNISSQPWCSGIGNTGGNYSYATYEDDIYEGFATASRFNFDASAYSAKPLVLDVESTGTWTAWVNGTQVYQTAQAYSGIASGAISFGSQSSMPVSAWAGQLAEVVVCGKGLTADERAQMMLYLSTRYAIAL